MGGYHTKTGYTVAWRRLFRSGELRHMTKGDLIRFKEEKKLNTVIDLRNSAYDPLGIGSLNELRVKYYKIPLDIFPASNSSAYETERKLF